MIRVSRGDAPPGFANRAQTLKDRFAAYRQQQPKISASAVWSKVRGDIEADVEILAQRFHHKCAYCEATPGHVSHPHVEHFRPKGIARFEGKMFDWDNWLLSCGICNEEKWKHFPEEEGLPLLLNPAEEDPSHDLCFAGPRLRGTTKRGRKTVELVELDRQPLLDERESWLNLVNSLLLLCVESEDMEVRHAFREHLIWTMQDDAPFAGMTRAYLAEKCPKLAHPAAPHPRLAEGDRLDHIRELVEQRTLKLQRLT
jgi:uncharacterized protein (TIGR02646 family)